MPSEVHRRGLELGLGLGLVLVLGLGLGLGLGAGNNVSKGKEQLKGRLPWGQHSPVAYDEAIPFGRRYRI